MEVSNKAKINTRELRRLSVSMAELSQIIDVMLDKESLTTYSFAIDSSILNDSNQFDKINMIDPAVRHLGLPIKHHINIDDLLKDVYNTILDRLNNKMVEYQDEMVSTLQTKT